VDELLASMLGHAVELASGRHTEHVAAEERRAAAQRAEPKA
jgi:hypothetical protein